MLVLGLNAGYPNAAAALFRDGELVFAAQEERFNRVKHSAGFPEDAIRACLEAAGVSIASVDHIAVSSKPTAHMEEDVLFALSGRSTFGSALRDRLERVARFFNVRAELARRFSVAEAALTATVHEVEHHHAGLAAGFLPHTGAHQPGGAEDAAVLSLGSFGDFASTVFGRVHGGELSVTGKVLYPHSLGILYTMVSQYLGLGDLGSEGKVMGLAAHGNPTMRDATDQLFRRREDGGFELCLEFFTHHLRGLDMTWEGPIPAVERIFSDAMVEAFGPPRRLGEPIGERHQDIAASLQASVTDWAIELTEKLAEETKASTLYFAGMLAESAQLASALRERSPFEHLLVAHAAGDAGTALGAALVVQHRLTGETPPAPTPYSGASYSDAQIESALEERGVERAFTHEPERQAAELLAAGKVVGWFQGAMELGPRALGNRCILADPRQQEMRDHMNTRVKFRETFLPFAASFLAEHTGEFFANAPTSPAMQFVGTLRPEVRDTLPAVTHVDGSIRFQDVAANSPSRLRQVLEQFHAITGCPALLNTSLNENGPIVRTPGEALTCFRATGMDALVIGSFVVTKG